MIAANRIIYNGLSSIDLDLIVDVAFDSDDGETSSFLNREAIASETHTGEFKRVHNYKWNEVFTPKFTFVKKDFSEFTKSELRKLYAWLTSKSTASFITVYYDDSEVISWEALGGFIECSAYKISNNRTVGVVATFESVTPFAFSPLHTITKDVSDPKDNKVIINLETDDSTPVYPRITIEQDSNTNIISIAEPMKDTDDWVEGSIFYYYDEENDIDIYYWIDAEGVKHESNTNDSNIDATSVYIKNTHTDDKGNISVFDALSKNNIKGEVVTLDGANRVVFSSRTNGRIFDRDFSWNWIPLYEGKNELDFTGNCTVTLEYREVRKIGEF